MKTKRYFWMACIALSALGFYSCSEDDGDGYPGGDGPVVVNAIYLEDADGTVKDRPVDFARLGQTIRLEGSGFGGTRHVLVNGYDTYFNTAMVTNTNMVLQLLSSTPITDADPAVRNKIQFVKDNGTYTCDLVIRAASPSVTGINNSLPQPGERVVVYGANLQETTQLTLPGDIILDSGIESDPDGEWYAFSMPDNCTEGGHIYSVGANGNAQSPDFFNQKAGLILNFDGVGNQGYWSWSETGSMINDEDLVSDPLESGRGTVCKIIPDRLLAEGISPLKSRATECWTAGNDNPADDWNHFVNDGLFNLGTPLEDVAFQFDIYCPEPWAYTGQIEITVQNNVSFNGYGSDEVKSSTTQAYVWVPWLVDGEVVPFQTEGWQTVTIPLSLFSKYANMISDGEVPMFETIIADRKSASYCNFGMGFVNTDIVVSEDKTYESQTAKFPIYIDNWRIVPFAQVAISDFED